MKIKAEIRSKKGKGGAKSLRRIGKIPGILYGHGEKPVLIQIDEKELKSLTSSEHLTLEVAPLDFGKELDVLIKEIQVEPTTSKPLHIDFQHLHRGEKVKVKIPVIVEGTDEVIKKGGILEQILSEVEIECLPKDIPSEIKVDIAQLKIGEAVHVNELPPIKGRFITPPDSTILTILSPKAVVKEEPPVEEVPKEEVEEEKEGEKGKSEKITKSE